MKLILGRYTRGNLWTLFLMCAFPLHLWTLILVFRDIPWLAERTNMWDAVGVAAYGLMFALIESAIVFCIAVLLGFLVPRNWGPERRTALLGAFSLILALWAIVDQAFFLAWWRLPPGLISLWTRSQHPLRELYAFSLAFVGASFLVPAWAVLRNGKGVRIIQATMDRLGLLSVLYLILDIPALFIVVIRNV